MNTDTQLLIEIENLRKQLHRVIELADGNFLAEDVLKLSQKLDKLLTQYTKNQSNTNKRG